MNKLTTEKRTAVVRALIEGCSIASTTRMTGVCKPAILKLLADLGNACADFHNNTVRGIKTARVQCDEIWAFVGAKQKQVDNGAKVYGDAWTWTAIDADTKLLITWTLGARDEGTACDFIDDLAGRLNSRVQLTTDGLNAYLAPIMDAFGSEVDYGQLVKLFGNDPRLKSKNPSARYSPGVVMGSKPYARIGTPDVKHISTSFVERNNLNMRMGMRRFTRLTNAFSKKVENHGHMLAIYFVYYNFCRVHQTLRVTPAMRAGLTDRLWELEELIGLLAQEEAAKPTVKRGPYRKIQN